MQKFIFPAPGDSVLSITEQQILMKYLFTTGQFDSRRWRNQNEPEVKQILDKLVGQSLSEKVFGGIYGYSTCMTCGGSVKLASFTVGWERFCSRSCAQRNDSVRTQAKMTCLSRHGGETIWDIPGNKEKIRRKISATKKRKREQVIKDQIKTDISVVLDGSQWVWTHSCGKKWTTSIARKNSSCPQCSSSKPELEIIEMIKRLKPDSDIKQHDRTILYPKELDIVVDNRFAIEYNGAYHHRESLQRAAQDKVINSAKNGIRLFTVLESDWVHNRQKVEDKIASYMVPLRKIGARKLVIDDRVSQNEAKVFLEHNHFSGSAGAREFCGLRNINGELLCLATFSPTRFKSASKNEWELIRLCTRKDVIVQGGVSKLINHWKQNHPNDSLISYHDLRFGWSDGLSSVGFTLVEVTKPGWRWVKGKSVLERWSTQKKKIKGIIPDADLSKTETEIMKENGWIQEFNCGNSKWKL